MALLYMAYCGDHPAAGGVTRVMISCLETRCHADERLLPPNSANAVQHLIVPRVCAERSDGGDPIIGALRARRCSSIRIRPIGSSSQARSEMHTSCRDCCSDNAQIQRVS